MVTFEDAPFAKGDMNNSLTAKELEIVRVENARTKFFSSITTRSLAYFSLFVLLLTQISNQWQRFVIGSAYYFDDPDVLPADTAKYNIGVAIPGLNDFKYAIISGPAFNLSFAVLILFAGPLVDIYKRIILISIANVLWSFSSVATGFT